VQIFLQVQIFQQAMFSRISNNFSRIHNHSSADFNKFTTTQVQILINSAINVTKCRFSRNQACWPNSIASADFPTSADFPASNVQQNFQQFQQTFQQFNIAIYSSILQYIAEFPAI